MAMSRDLIRFPAKKKIENTHKKTMKMRIALARISREKSFQKR